MPEAGGPPPLPFDPATGEWIREDAAPVEAAAAPRRGAGPTFWNILLILDFTVLGLTLALSVRSVLLGLETGGLPSEVGELRQAIWAQVAFNLLLFGVIPLGWVVGTRARPWQGAVQYLQLHRPGRGLLHGVLWGMATLAGLLVLSIALEALDFETDTRQADALVEALTPSLALALAFSAAVGEEILFRGVLQKWLGVWGQAALFGLFHLSYGTPLQVVVPLLLGLLYGVLVKRGAPLWTPIAAHFVFDYVQFAAFSALPAT